MQLLIAQLHEVESTFDGMRIRRRTAAGSVLEEINAMERMFEGNPIIHQHCDNTLGWKQLPLLIDDLLRCMYCTLRKH